MPFSFYVTCLLIVLLGIIAWNARWKGWGLPMGMVLATVSVWYVGDAVYNDYSLYRVMLKDDILDDAWWQVCLFLFVFGMFVPLFHGWLNARLLRKERSHVMAYLELQRSRHPTVQRRIDQLTLGLFGAWFLLMLVALVRVEGNFIGLFAPYFGEKSDPWARGQIGGGFSAFISLAAYLQIFLTSAFGVVAALALHPRSRNIAFAVCLLAFPYYLFDRTRNTMLATMLPGLLAFIFMRLRAGLVTKVICLIGGFLVVNFWFSTVMANRSGMKFDIQGALSSKSHGSKDRARHEGLNMLEELGWINYFISTGEYLPNWKQHYFAEIVNPIPRGLWKNKPTIGLNYALARGQAVVGASGETTATISTGMIGQGVVNFGRIFGPIAAAALMALWVSTLARQDLLGTDPGRMILYGTGLILTFNTGRDVTLLVLYPFFFGVVLFYIFRWYSGPSDGSQRRRKGRKRSRKFRHRLHRDNTGKSGNVIRENISQIAYISPPLDR